MTGLAILVGAPKPPVGRMIRPIRVRSGDVTLFEGQGRVVRTEAATADDTLVAIALVDCYIDVPRLIAHYRQVQAAVELADRLGQAEAVPRAYRELCGDLLHMLRSYRVLLDRTDPGNEAEAQALYELCEARILPSWRTYWHQANTLVRPLLADETAKLATKRYTESIITPELAAGPLWRRTYEKPLGYPGDYLAMDMIYRWEQEGATLGDRLMHRLALDTAEAIRNRANIMRRIIAERMLGGDSAPLQVANLGCGSAQEIHDYLSMPRLPRPIAITLVDQDDAALRYAYERSYPHVARHGQLASLSGLNASFQQIMGLQGSKLLDDLPPQDLVYSLGLLDYIPEARSRRIIASLFAKLAPGGTLVVGNGLDAPEGALWPMEFALDWPLIFRTEQEMRRLADGLPGVITTEIEPRRQVIMLRIDKPQTA
jgi:hypothetical protein